MNATPLRHRIRVGENGHGSLMIWDVMRVDTTDIEHLRLYVYTRDGTMFTSHGIHAIEAAMVLCPEALENRRMRWPRHMWSLHNLVGHPLMQMLAFAGFYKAAFWVHDVTVPKPVGARHDFGASR